MIKKNKNMKYLIVLAVVLTSSCGVFTKLTEEQKKQIDIYDHGVLVEQITPGPAQESGIRRGDVLLLMDNIKIEDVRHFKKIVKKLPKERSISVLIQRRYGPKFLALKLKK